MLEFRIASKFLRSSKGQTILIILGIAIGVSVQVFIGTLIQGLQKSLVDKTIGSSPQITVTSEDNDGSIDRWEDKIKSIKNSNSKVENVSASTDFSAFIDKNNKTYPVLIRGFEFANADKIYKIKDNIKIGREPKDENEVLIGIDLKKDASLKVGDKITIFYAKRCTKGSKDNRGL